MSVQALKLRGKGLYEGILRAREDADKDSKNKQKTGKEVAETQREPGRETERAQHAANRKWGKIKNGANQEWGKSRND
jgi:hypothetical protein